MGSTNYPEYSHGEEKPVSCAVLPCPVCPQAEACDMAHFQWGHTAVGLCLLASISFMLARDPEIGIELTTAPWVEDKAVRRLLSVPLHITLQSQV